MQEHLIRFDKTSNFLFVDLETENTCLNTRYNKPWQMALLNAVNGMKTDAKEIWIKWPNFKFSKGAARLAHSYSREKMEEIGVSPQEALEIFDSKLITADYLIGHNILNFDVHLLMGLYRVCGRKPTKFPTVIDTQAVAKGIVNNLPYQAGDNFLYYQYKILAERIKGSKTSQTAMAKYYDIPVDENLLHDAVYDLDVNLAIWNKMKFQIQL